MVPCTFWEVGISGTRSLLGVGMSWGGYVRDIGTTPPGHGTWDTTGYGQQVGSTYPTGMLSYLCFYGK